MYDIAVYGSGFAGYSVAAPALERGCSVIVVEKGPRADFRRSVELARVLSPWEPVESGTRFGIVELGAAANTPRFIGLGGTSTVWTGRWRPLDAVDFLRRKEDRCWPFDRGELEPHYRAASARFGFSLENDLAADPFQSRAADAGIRLVPTTLRKPPIRLAEKWISLANDYPRLTILTDVGRSEFHVNDGGIEHVRLIRNDGDSTEIEARQHVIAAGGIESAGLVRELHCTVSGSLQPFLGGYMDHPKGVAGALWPTRNLDDLDRILERDEVGLSLPEDEVLERGIGNHLVFLSGRSRRDKAATGRLRVRAINLWVHVEQFPEKCNGIDYRRPSNVRWKISAKTRQDVDLFLRLISSRIEVLFGRVGIRTWIDFSGASHPAGCTPMSATPRGCQLYPDGRLNSLANIYCISSSAFPFAGSANPTMTVVALGNRLSAQLSRHS